MTLELRDLSVSLRFEGSLYPVLKQVNLSVGSGQILGIVGESGAGKSMVARSIMGILPKNAVIESGNISIASSDNLLTMKRDQRRALKGRIVTMVFQNAREALSPSLRVGFQMSQLSRSHLGESRTTARNSALEMLSRVGIGNPDRVYRQYPHELSGGMCQRVMIGMSLITEPSLVIADEPTSGLDVVVQRQILELLADIGGASGRGMLFISHDLAVVTELCDIVAVMYGGEIVEFGPAQNILTDPKHPYTQGLVVASELEEQGATEIPGAPPTLTEKITGCHFHPRCAECSTDLGCAERHPERYAISSEEWVRCFLHEPRDK